MNIITRRKNFIWEKGYKTISSFADALGENVTNVSKVILGKQVPRIEKLFHWASALNCDIVELLWLFYYDDMSKMTRRIQHDKRRNGKHSKHS